MIKSFFLFWELDEMLSTHYSFNTVLNVSPSFHNSGGVGGTGGDLGPSEICVDDLAAWFQ